eukprot:CAMPEP_0113559976 /NCGR_PEP_ID=MMETSP0015_2-20120614/19186_1 /TAXON_ID=2838 /ORGANISM="Odontella" /LENGTH=222 /DNA_ID=CAMNT_0000461653 /DNA_START=152 /DNA_END=818 /DNA_ORIENTATION=+ /assembly_acc=CAM_ASM_000160
MGGRGGNHTYEYNILPPPPPPPERPRPFSPPPRTTALDRQFCKTVADVVVVSNLKDGKRLYLTHDDIATKDGRVRSNCKPGRDGTGRDGTGGNGRAVTVSKELCYGTVHATDSSVVVVVEDGENENTGTATTATGAMMGGRGGVSVTAPNKRRMRLFRTEFGTVYTIVERPPPLLRSYMVQTGGTSPPPPTPDDMRYSPHWSITRKFYRIQGLRNACVPPPP